MKLRLIVGGTLICLVGGMALAVANATAKPEKSSAPDTRVEFKIAGASASTADVTEARTVESSRLVVAQLNAFRRTSPPGTLVLVVAGSLLLGLAAAVRRTSSS